MEELIKKIGHRIGEVSDRAVRSLYSKISNGLCTIDEIMEIESGTVAALLLHWINERQTQAEVQTLNSALKMLLEISQTVKGCGLLIDLQAVEFLNSYYKYVPSTLQMTVTSILNCLISPNFKPVPRDEEDIIPKPRGFEYQAIKKLPKPSEENSDKPCEYPPVLLCESDEKLFFDATVTLKFGATEEIVQTCSELISRLLKDFPCEVFLQHGDLLRTLLNLVKVSSQKQVFEVAMASLSFLSGFLRKLGIFFLNISKPESRPASSLPKKIVPKNEYLEISVPCLKTEQWEIGTPGPTFSLFYAVEFIITELPLDCIEILAPVLDVWKEAEWFFPSLLKHPSVIQRMLDNIAASITLHTQINASSDVVECKVYIQKMLKIVELILISIPTSSVALCLKKSSAIVPHIAEYLIFQQDTARELLPYIQEVDQDMVSEFYYAEKCQKAIESYKTMNQLLMHEEVLPINNISGFNKAVDFFSNILPALEFSNSSLIISAILDLNCYSLYIEKNSTNDSKKQQCLSLSLSLLTSTLPSIVSITLDKIEDFLNTEKTLLGLAQGSKRKDLLRELILNSEMLYILIVKYKASSIITRLMKEPEDYEKLVPVFTVLQGFNDENLEGILHMVSITNPVLHPLRFFRDLFSASPSRRAIAVTVLRSSKTPEKIQENYKDLIDQMFSTSSLPDPVLTLSPIPELSTLAPTPSLLSQDELINLLNIFRSTTLESNLKVSASEQILLHLYSGLNYDSLIEEILTSSINNLLPDNEDRYTKRLISKSLQILVLIALKYDNKAKKLYMAPVKFMCSLVPYIFNSYDQIRHYSMYLLYILSFSALIPRNKFVPCEHFMLVPQSEANEAGSVPVISVIFPGFLEAFPTNKLECGFYPEATYVKNWKNVPSSTRVRGFVNKTQKLNVDADQLLDCWGKKLSVSDTHKNIIGVCYEWLNTLKVAFLIPGNIHTKLIRTNSDLISCILSILRSPSVNQTEDSLHIALQQILRSAITGVNDKNKDHLEFVQSVSSVISKNSLPFISEITEISLRKPLVMSILSVFSTLIPFHGSSLQDDRTLHVLSKHQLEPGPLSFLALLHKLVTSTDDISLIEGTLKTLIHLLDHPQLELSTDLFTSPTSQKYIKNIVSVSISKLTPFINPSTFIYKSSSKTLLQLLTKISNLIELESYMWCIRFTEDRDLSLRVLSWTFLSQKSIDCYSLHSSILDIALEVVFGLPESFAVKTQACLFLNKLTEFIVNSEESVHRAGIIKALYQFAVISHVKTLLFENAGPPPVYFAVLVNLLNNLVIIDSAKVVPICIQIDVWEGLVRLLRPGAFEDRCKNEKRKPFKGQENVEFDQVLLGLISLCTFFSNIIRNDIQVLDYLLESSHFISHLLSWMEVIIERFDHSNEVIHSKSLLGVINVLHLSIFKSQKTIRHLSGFNFPLLSKIMEMSQSKDLKISLARLLTSLLSSIPSENTESLLLHLISLFKSTVPDPEHRDITKSLTSLLYNDESAKVLAIKTGFSDYLLETSVKLLTAYQSLELQKTRKKEEESSVSKQILDYLTLFKLWAANSNAAKIGLSVKDGKVGSMFKLLFQCWTVALRKEELLKAVLETLCTGISTCEEAKKACAILQDNRQSLLSLIIEYISRPNSASDPCFAISLKILGSLCSCKESRQLLIKSKYPQGLSLRLIKEWNETKLNESIPAKSPFIIEFLTSFTFFTEGQKVISGIVGLVDILVEVLDKFSRTAVNFETVEQALLILRNLSFSSFGKPHVIANQRALPLILGCISSPSQKSRLRKLASSTLWALLFHYQKFKGILSKEQVFGELESVYKEVCRDSERCRDKQTAEELKAVGENLNCVLKICMGN